MLRKARQQESQGVGRVRRTEPPLDVGHANARMLGDPCRGFQPFPERRRVARILQRVLRRQHPPDFVEAQPLQRQQRDVAVSFVGRIERAAEKPDPARADGQTPAPFVAPSGARPSDDEAGPAGIGALAIGVKAGIGRNPGRRT